MFIRFDPLRASGCLVSLMLAFAAMPGARPSAHAAEHPNIVLILADDLGFGDLACYGHARFRTPCLDKMAAEGIRLTQFNTPCPFCAPTRASLMTGRYPARCGLVTNPSPDALPAADGLHLPESEILLPQLLAQAGYATAMIGKWHLGHKRQEWWPTHRGFDQYFGILYSNDMRPVRLIDGDQVVEYPVVQATLTRRYTERALDFMEHHGDKPFFLYLAHAMPHKPLACSENFYQKSEGGLYGDCLAELDWSVGQILAKLKQIGADERTLVIFTSDNGPYYGGSSGHLRGMKGTAWEGGFRVPCIIRWPGRVPKGKTIDRLAITMDLFVTALAAAGAPPPADRVIDGRDLMPILTSDAPSQHDVIFGQNRSEFAVVRDQRWKLHTAPQAAPAAPNPHAKDKRAPDGVTLLAPYEQIARNLDLYPGLRSGEATVALSLFDLENDPGEQHDVAGAHPDVVARLKAAFDAAKREMAAK